MVISTDAAPEPLPTWSSPGSCPAKEEVFMGHVRVSDHINAPIDQVWDLNASCERVPEWNGPLPQRDQAGPDSP